MDVAGEWLGCLDLIVYRRVKRESLVQHFNSLRDDERVFCEEFEVTYVCLDERFDRERRKTCAYFSWRHPFLP